jgi:hypothetical protein
MENRVLDKRFGAIAIEKGFITKEQFVEGMAMQIEDDIEGTEHRLIGSLLSNMGYMTSQQVHEVLEVLLAR